MPKHVAIIMDGNGRWAQERGLPRAVGHRYGVEAVRRTIRAALALSLPVLTIYSFSSENWARPTAEIDDLMGLMKRFLRRDLAELHQKNVRIRMIGRRAGIDPDLLAMVDDAVSLTAHNTALTLVIAFNYGSRDEIADAARHLAQRVLSGDLAPEDITPDLLGAELATSDLPQPDLLIRTSGEVRLSNFLLWQLAYAELVFLDDYWPDFNHDLLVRAIEIFHARDRRYGALSRKVGG